MPNQPLESSGSIPNGTGILTREEILNLSQIVISSGIKHAPNVFAFTEQGVAMLSSVLRSKRAVRVNIEIMRAFVRLKRAISLHRELAYKLDRLERKVGKHEGESSVNDIAPSPPRTRYLIRTKP